MFQTEPKSHYVPAMVPGMVKSVIESIPKAKSEKILWWRKGAFFHHPWLLCSAFYGLEEKVKLDGKTFREWFGMDRDTATIMGDSGGFQSQTQGNTIPNERIIQWYEDNCDYGFIQDFPEEFLKLTSGIQDLSGGWGDFEIFKKCSQAVAKSNRDFSNHEFQQCKIYNVCHGLTLKQLEYWFETCRDDKFWGWAVGMKPPTPIRTAFNIAFMHHKGIRQNLHLFGVSGNNVIPLMVYASKYIKFITFDSSTYAVGSMLRRFINPMLIKHKFTIGEKSGKKFSKIPCDCPVCENITNMEVMYKSTSLPGFLISIHNLWFLLRYTKLLHQVLEVEEEFMEMVRLLCSKETTQAIQFLKYSVENGFEDATRKYMNILQEGNSLLTEQTRSFQVQSLIPEPEKSKGKKGRRKPVEEDPIEVAEQKSVEDIFV